MANTAEKKIEIFLIKTLTSIEHKFQPCRVRLTRRMIGRLEWEIGDIAVRKTRNGGHVFRMIPRTQLCMLLGRSLGSKCQRYTQVTVQLVAPPKSSNPGNISFDGASLTYKAEYADNPVLQVILHEHSSKSSDWAREFSISLDSDQTVQVVLYNKNKLLVTNREGATRYFLLYGFVCFEARSFSPRDILLSMATCKPFREHPSKLTLCRPLWFFWTDEYFELRVVAQEIEEQNYCLNPNSIHRIDRALRFVIDRMIDRRRAINDHLVTLLLNVASDLDLNHPSLERMKQIVENLSALTEIKSQGALQASLLNELIRFDLKRVLPIFEHQVHEMCTDLGPAFTLRVQSELEMQGGAFTQRSNSLLALWSSMIEKVLLRATQKICELAPTSDSTSQVRPRFGSCESSTLSIELLADQDAERTEHLRRYTAIILHSMPRFSRLYGSTNTPRNPPVLADLAALLYESCGYQVDKRRIVGWKDCSDYSVVDSTRQSTSLNYFDLAILEKSLVRDIESDRPDIPTNQWRVSVDIPLSFYDPRWIHFTDGALYMIHPKALTIVRFTPKVSQTLYESPEGIELRCSSFFGLRNSTDCHPAMVYSPQFRMLLLADIQGTKIDSMEMSIGVSLRAFGFPNSERLSLVASQHYPVACIPKELSWPWEIPPRYSRQGITPNTYNLPYSPIRWCCTRRNIYFLWLLSPRAHFVYGLKANTFVIVSMRHSDCAPIIEQPFVLPNFSRDTHRGMCPLYIGENRWDRQQRAYFVTVYQIQLRHW